jgi:signal transduction histidine kinase
MSELNFSVDSALLSELGEKLVETVHLALVELVKNSYDADAKQVKISFKKKLSTDEIDEIQIIDNGSGMNFYEVKNYWMKIATTNKVKNNFSSIYGRPRTGAKGIGRFCSRRLGKRLRLITVGKNSKGELEKTDVTFNWQLFKPGSDITTIKCNGSQTNPQNEPTGTILIINNLNQEWNKIGFNYVQRQLAVLAANQGTKRKGFKEDEGFNIELAGPYLEQGLVDLRGDLMNAGWGTLTGEINKDNKAVYTLIAKDLGTKKFTSNHTYKILKDCAFKIGILVDDREQMRNTAIISKTTLDKILPDWGGVQVKYRGFRIYPYGDDDWLGIDSARGLRKAKPSEQLTKFAGTLRGVDPNRSLLSLLSRRSYVGNVEIGYKSKGFEMKSNREGFIENDSIIELKHFVREAIDWSTIYRDFYLRNRIREEANTARKSIENILDFEIDDLDFLQHSLDYLHKEIKSISTYAPPAERREAQKTLNLVISAISKRDKANVEELRHLRLIASSSILLLMFSHEAKSLIGLIDDSQSRLKLLSNKLKGDDNQFASEIGDNLLETRKRFNDLLELTGKFSIDKDSTNFQKISLSETAKNVLKTFKQIINKYSIEVDMADIPINLLIDSLNESELLVILINLISNAIKSVIASGTRRIIKIIAFIDKGEKVIRIFDTGVGLDKIYYKEAFIPFIADPQGNLYKKLNKNLNSDDKFIIGFGSGLGLSIIKDIIEYHNGKISFCQPDNNWSAVIEVRLK